MKDLVIVFIACFCIVCLLPKKTLKEFERVWEGTKTRNTHTDYNVKSNYDTKTVEYFNEITLKNENNSRIKNTPDKYKKNVKLYVYGDYEDYMLNEINNVINDLNDIIVPIEFSIVDNKGESNMVIFFGDYESFISHNPDLSHFNKIKNSEGYFRTKTTNSNEIKSSRIFINLPKQDNTDDVKDVIREEITQALGFYNDSWLYPESCFYQGGNDLFEYSEIDVNLIKMLYNE